ncbi:MAG: hypothetical protein D6785_11220 [Planctomycetota bacterium]|nr:MAG: hypothetical protein D6785_11220 [Planctomycetota bacterium]
MRRKIWLFLLIGFSSVFSQTHLSASIPSEANRLWKQENYRKAALILDKYLKKHPRSFQALLLRGKIALEEKDLVVAHEIFEKLVKWYPHSHEGYYYLGKALSRLRKLKKAFRALEIARSLRPGWHKPYIELGWLYLAMRKIDIALKTALYAKKLSSSDSAVFSLLGYIYFRKKKISKCRMAFQKALKLDPLNLPAHWYLGTGLGYPNTPEKLPKNQRDWKKLQEGIQYLEKGEFQKGISIFSKLVKKYPRNSTCHFLLAETLSRKYFSKERVQSIPEFKMLQAIYFSRPPKKKVLASFFSGYSNLWDKEKRVLAHLSYPFEPHIRRLASIGYIHYLLPLDKRLGDVPYLSIFKDRYSQDGRRYGDLRGLTYEKAVSGKETLWNAYQFGYNTVAHELAHQVHMYSFSRKKQQRIESLYRKALREKRALDYYSATSVYEYFAQGYEAFISRFKRPGLGFTARHTRKELLEKDPQLYEFLKKVTLPDFQPLELFLIYFFMGRIYQELKEKEKAKSAYAMAFLIGVGLLDRD